MSVEIIVGLVAVGLVAVWIMGRRRTPPSKAKRRVAVDGTNVLFWRDDTALLSTLQILVRQLRHMDIEPVVFLDASSRHHIGDKSLNEAKFAKALRLDQRQVMVCPKGTEADAFILEFAREHKLSVVSNDRFRDRPSEARNVRLIKGRFQGERLVLKGL